MDCLFCKIAALEVEAKVLAKNEDAVAILDISPRAPGHTMVLPRVHADSILDLKDSKLGSIFGLVKVMTGVLNKVFSPDGFTIGINHGRAAGQAVDHLHVHIIPRWRSDGGASIHGVVNNPPHESLDEVERRIKIFLRDIKVQ
ncbi:MAG: HIT family protein [Patescibacteria group bacterium]